MSKKCRNHSPDFKSKVALAAINGDQSLTEISQRDVINSNLIVKWKKPLIEQSSEVFASVKGLTPDRKSEIQLLQANIVQLTMENNFLSKVLVVRVRSSTEKGHGSEKTFIIQGAPL